VEGLHSPDIVMYGNVMRERSRLATAPARSGAPALKLRFRASHHGRGQGGVAPLRISHHGSLWQPPVKEADREEVQVPRRKKK